MDRTYRRIGAVIVVAVLAVSACTQLQSPRPVDSSPIDLATTTTIDTPEPEPFIYRIGVLDGLTTANFWAFQGEQTTIWNAYILGPTKPSLFAPHPSSGALQPELATGHVEPTETNGVWTVKVSLNPEMRWSDGHPITASDIVFTYETVRRLGLGGTWAEAYPSAISEVASLDDHQVIITFTVRPTLAVWPHAVGLAPVMPAHIWQDRVHDITSPSDLYALPSDGDVGGGPLALDTFSENLIVTSANPGYSTGTTPDRVEYHVFGDEAEAVNALNDGRIDTVLSPKGLNTEHLNLVSPDGDITVNENPAHGVRYLGFNLDRQPMAEPAFRKALALILEREIDTLVPEGNLLWFDPTVRDEIASRYNASPSERLTAAIQGLRAAGYTWETEPSYDNGLNPGSGLRIHGTEPQTLTILTPGDAWDPTRPEYAAEVAQALHVLGFTAIPVETDFDTVVDLAFTPGETGERQYDMYLLGWTLGSPSLPGYYRLFFATDGPMNNTGYSSDFFTEQLNRYENSYTTDEARRALWAMESILADDLPYLLLYGSSITEAYRADRVTYLYEDALGGLQGRLGGIGDVSPIKGS